MHALAARPLVRSLLLAAAVAGLLSPRPLAADAGDLDCTFGAGGVAVHDLGSIEAAFDAQLQSDDKIVTLGSAPGSLRLSRFLPDGGLDPAFGSGGTIVHPFSGLGFARTLAIDSLDRIVVGGGITVSDGGPSDQEAFVARFTADGALDTTFDGDGWTSFDFTAATATVGTEGVSVVVVDASDRPIVGGSPDANGPVFNPSDRNMAVARLTTSGVLDTTFGSAGIALASSPGTATDDDIRGLALDPSGRVVALGSTGNTSPRNTIVARWTTAGALDTTFDGDGVLILDLSETGGDDFGLDVGFTSTGAIIVLGSEGGPALARLTDTGALDTTFAGDGILQQSFLGSQDVTAHVRVQSDDKILVTGWPIVVNSFHFAVMRLTTAGTLDSTWSGPDGVATTSVGFNERAYSAVLRSDGKLLLAGGLNNDTDMVMARYLNDGQPNGPLTTTEILSDSPDPSLVSETVTVTFSVTSTAGTPSGTVTVSDGTAAGCSATVAEGSCTLAWGIFPGDRTLTARYPGGGGFCSSSDTESHTVQVPTRTSFTLFTPDPSVVGEPVTVGVNVVPDNVGGVGPVTGSVMVSDGAGASCTGSLVGGSTSCTLTPTAAGTRTWTAIFPAAGDFAGSSQTTSRTIGPALTATTITADSPDPSQTPQPIQVDVAVSTLPPGAGTPSGDVLIEDGTGASCTATLAAGVGSCMLATTVAGTRDLSATYLGNGNFASSSGTEPHQFDDGIAPRVTDLETLAGAAISECTTLTDATAGARVTFDEPVQGAEQVGSYRLLGAGPDGDFSTSSCAGTLGDDIPQAITSATSDGDPSTPTVTLQLAARLPTGLVRLIVCEAVEDVAGNPLDGDGDGAGGDPFLVTFRADPGNLFANGDFDRCPVTLAPWQEMATPPNAVLASDSEDADASTLSGSANLVSSSASPTAIAQCVDFQAGRLLLELTLRARLDAVGAATATLDAGCGFFDQAACAGSAVGDDTVAIPLPDLGGGWSRFQIFLDPPPVAASALCSATVTADDPGEPTFDAYLDGLSLKDLTLFEDGFESGDTSAWSQTVGN